MNILVMGMGYVGTTMAASLAEDGHTVTGYDVDPQKIAALQNGQLYFHEPGLESLVNKLINNSRLRFTTEAEAAINRHHLLYICVGTPSSFDGNADLTYVQHAAKMIGQYMREPKTVVMKSTVPIGTARNVQKWIRNAQQTSQDVHVVSNPEFLREGTALKDARNPDRIVIGADNEHSKQLLQRVYASYTCPIVCTDTRTAELIKYASNAFLAMKISFVNDLAKLCDAVQANVQHVSCGMGLDERIGHHSLQAGIGYGGSCFPKDVAALNYMAQQYGIRLSLVESTEQINGDQFRYVLEHVYKRIGGLANKVIAVFGLAFKPGTDDIRESPAIKVIQSLLAQCSQVRVHDPVVHLPEALRNPRLQQCTTPEQTAIGADAIIICTDWDDYRLVDWQRVYEGMRTALIVDGRNMLNVESVKQIGFDYQGVGYS